MFVSTKCQTFSGIVFDFPLRTPLLYRMPCLLLRLFNLVVNRISQAFDHLSDIPRFHPPCFVLLVCWSIGHLLTLWRSCKHSEQLGFFLIYIFNHSLVAGFFLSWLIDIEGPPRIMSSYFLLCGNVASWYKAIFIVNCRLNTMDMWDIQYFLQLLTFEAVMIAFQNF